MEWKNRICLDGSTLKLIAMITMLLDHIGVAIVRRYQNLTVLDAAGAASLQTLYQVLRAIGRTAFPIYAFLLVEGFIHTSNRKKYVFSLLLFAFLSEIPFDYALYGRWYPQHQNVFFTLAIGVCTLWLIETVERWFGQHFSDESLLWICRLIITGVSAAVAWVLHTDYSYKGIALIVIFYLFREMRIWSCIMGYMLFIGSLYSIVGFCLPNLYNGKRGKQHKYFLYLFYPLHLLALYLVSCLIL